MTDRIPAQLLRAASAARYAGCTGKTIRNWVKAGHLTRHEAPGGGLRVHGTDLASYLAQRQQRAHPPRGPLSADPYVPAVQVRRSERRRWHAACKDLRVSQRAAFLDALDSLEQRAEAAHAAL